MAQIYLSELFCFLLQGWVTPRDRMNNEVPPVAGRWERTDPLGGPGGAQDEVSRAERRKERKVGTVWGTVTQPWDLRICRNFQACVA